MKKQWFLIYLFFFTFLTACDKMREPSPVITEKEPSKLKTLNGSNKNPYSIGNIRDVKWIFSQLEDEVASQLARVPIEDKDLQLYIRYKAQTESEYKRLESVSKLDASLVFYGTPLDNTTFAASRITNFSSQAFNQTYGEKEFVYTVIPKSKMASMPLISFTVLDTLYIPKENEPYLDFFAHLITDNIDDQTMAMFGSDYPDLYKAIEEGITEGAFGQKSMKAQEKFRFLKKVFKKVFNVVSHIFNGISSLAGWGTYPQGFIRVLDDATGQNIGVEGCRVDAIHWGAVVSGTTNQQGQFIIPRRFWFGSLVSMVFDNSKCFVKQFDTNRGWVATIPLQYILGAATHIDGFHSAAGMGNLQRTFTGHTQVRYWSMITNGVHEFHRHASALGVRNPSKVTIFAHWADANGSASAPMLGYISLSSTAIQYLGRVFGVNLNIPPFQNTLFTRLPDITIKESAVFERRTNWGDIKQTLYHELGYSSHFFQVGTAYWTDNIAYSVSAGDAYGTDRNALPGSFFSLTEGWADYIGMTFAARQYPAYQARVFNPETGGFLTTLYGRHLELNQRFFNDFIPRGLFHDLTDTDPNTIRDERFFDRVNRYTTGQMYQALRPNVRSIPDFERELVNRWGGAGVALDDLFNNYNF